MSYQEEATRGGVIDRVEDIASAETSAGNLRKQITWAIETFHPNLLSEYPLVGAFPVAYREIPVINTYPKDTVLPQLPLVAVLEDGIDPQIIRRLSVVQSGGWATFLNICLYGNPLVNIEVDDPTGDYVRCYFSRGSSIISNTSALIEKRGQGIQVDNIFALGMYVHDTPGFGIKTDSGIINAELFPIAIPTKSIIAFDQNDWLWTPKTLAQRKHELEEEAKLAILNTPVDLGTQPSDNVLRAWQESPIDSFYDLWSNLQTPRDALRRMDIAVLPHRSVSWGSSDQITGFVERAGYWDNGIIATGIHVIFEAVSADALRNHRLQRAQTSDDALRVQIYMGPSGRSVVMKATWFGASGQGTKDITDTDTREFWIRAIGAMKVVPIKAHEPKQKPSKHHSQIGSRYRRT